MARVMLPHLHLLKMSPNSSNYLDTLGVWSSELDLEYIKRRNEAQALLKEWIRQNEESGKIWQNAKNLNFRNSGNNIYKKTTSIHGLSKKQQIQQSITNSQAISGCHWVWLLGTFQVKASDVPIDSASDQWTIWTGRQPRTPNVLRTQVHGSDVGLSDKAMRNSLDATWKMWNIWLLFSGRTPPRNELMISSEILFQLKAIADWCFFL